MQCEFFGLDRAAKVAFQLGAPRGAAAEFVTEGMQPDMAFLGFGQCRHRIELEGLAVRAMVGSHGHAAPQVDMHFLAIDHETRAVELIQQRLQPCGFGFRRARGAVRQQEIVGLRVRQQAARVPQFG